jgi:hypothetical protein
VIVTRPPTAADAVSFEYFAARAAKLAPAWSFFSSSSASDSESTRIWRTVRVDGRVYTDSYFVYASSSSAFETVVSEVTFA